MSVQFIYMLSTVSLHSSNPSHVGRMDVSNLLPSPNSTTDILTACSFAQIVNSAPAV